MAATATVKYLGDLRTECTHLASGTVIYTDAPVDNKGKGELFSPTDLCATALASCAMTIMGIYAQARDLDITGAYAEVSKIMSKEAPRRIDQIDVIITMPDRDFSDKDKKGFELAMMTCPVHYSLHDKMEQNFIINWAK